MVSFSSLNFNNVGIPNPVAATSGTLVDVYNDLSEKKDNYIAVTLANDSKTDERASATKIGAAGSFVIGAAKLAINIARKGKTYKNPVLDWFMNGANFYMKWANKLNLGRSPIVNKYLGAAAYIASATTIGAGLGYGIDKYATAMNTKVDGKISHVQSGVNGSWIQSGLKSLVATDEGKQIIKDSIHKNDDDSVTVKFNGINKDYNITKKELNDASRSYVTYKSADGQTVTGFKKKYSKGDGDVLAFEVAFEKYCKDVKDGKVAEDENLPKSMYTFSDKGDLIFTSGKPQQLYYLLTGKQATRNNPAENKDALMSIYDKENLKNFINDYKLHPNNYAVEFTLKDENKNDKQNLKICDKLHIMHAVKNGSRYAVEHFDGKTAILTNADKTKDKMIVPLDNIEKYIAEANYIDLTKQN